MDGVKLDQLHEAKVIGVWLTEDLTWSKNTKEICKNAYLRISMITKLKYVGVGVEEDDCNALEVLPGLLADERTNDWSLMAVCSHEKEELIAGASALGVEVVPRSIFASNLVRLLQGFSVEEDSK